MTNQQDNLLAEGSILLPGERGEGEVGQAFNPVQFQLETAKLLAILLFLAFAFSVLVSAALAAFDTTENGLKVAQVLGPLTGGPLAVAVGYYFGASGR